MIKFLNKRFPRDNFPPVIVHIFYLMVSLTLCYLYYHKFVEKADFYGAESTGGIYAVLNNIAVKPLQFRLLVPAVFIALKKLFLLVHSVPDSAVFFLIIIAQCYLITLSFYFLLNKYFQNRAANFWIAPVILYPMVWNYIIMNGQFFFMDFGILLVITLGFYFIVSEQYGWLLVLFCFGLLNHPSVGYLIPAFLIFNYKKLFTKKTIIYTAVMCILYVAAYKALDYIFPREGGYFILYNLPRNLTLFHTLPFHILIRDVLFVFGGMHLLILVFIFTGIWKKYRGPLLYINLVVIPYIISIYINFSIEETRNYIAIIPFVLIPGLLFLSSLQNTFLAPVDKLSQSSQN